MKREKRFTRQNRNYWEAQISSWQSSGLSISKFCRQNNLNPRSLSNWKIKLNKSGEETINQQFVEISCFDKTLGHDNRTIEMTIGAARLVIREEIDPLVLRNIVLALGGI